MNGRRVTPDKTMTRTALGTLKSIRGSTEVRSKKETKYSQVYIIEISSRDRRERRWRFSKTLLIDICAWYVTTKSVVA